MTPELQILLSLERAGYFEKVDYDPRTVLQVCAACCGFDVGTLKGRDEVNSVICRMIAQGLVEFEYSSDSSVHPRDRLDFWRLVVTQCGRTALAQRMSLGETSCLQQEPVDDQPGGL